MLTYLLMTLLILTSIFLMILILIQRGKGGGLAGAFGGMGGQSAFGTKAGDMFTRITIGLAAFWIVLCIISVRVMAPPAAVLGPGSGSNNAPAKQTAPASTDNMPAPAGATPAQEVPSTPSKSP